ncbi:unnamed protein product, partial [Urochloa humidicola]
GEAVLAGRIHHPEVRPLFFVDASRRAVDAAASAPIRSLPRPAPLLDPVLNLTRPGAGDSSPVRSASSIGVVPSWCRSRSTTCSAYPAWPRAVPPTAVSSPKHGAPSPVIRN